MIGNCLGVTTSLLLGFALSACAAKKPLLSLDVLASAAERCGARELQFIRPGDVSAPPSFSYLDPGPFVSGKPTPVSVCLTEALEGYRFQSMEIRFDVQARSAAR